MTTDSNRALVAKIEELLTEHIGPQMHDRQGSPLSWTPTEAARAIAALAVPVEGAAPAGFLMTEEGTDRTFYSSPANVEFWKMAGHTAQPLYLAAALAPVSPGGSGEEVLGSVAGEPDGSSALPRHSQAGSATPSGITRDQFLRGVAAMEAYEEFRRRIYELFQQEGLDRVESLGGENLLSELQLQLEERCNDPRGQHGSMIEYMLYEPVPTHSVELADGRTFIIDTPEQLWDYWREAADGPFAPAEDGSQTRPTSDGEGISEGDMPTEPNSFAKPSEEG